MLRDQLQRVQPTNRPEAIHLHLLRAPCAYSNNDNDNPLKPIAPTYTNTNNNNNPYSNLLHPSSAW